MTGKIAITLTLLTIVVLVITCVSYVVLRDDVKAGLVIKPQVRHLQSGVLLYCLLGLMILLVSNLLLKQQGTAVCALLGLLAGGVAWVAVSILGAGEFGDSYVSVGRKTYAMRGEGFMQGISIYLYELDSVDSFRARHREIGEAPLDSPRFWISVVRPASRHPAGAELYTSPDGTIVGTAQENRCYLAYDTNTNRFFRREEMTALSPFLLIGPNDKLYDVDVNVLADDIARNALYPTIAQLEQATTHPNPNVREAANDLLSKARAKETQELKRAKPISARATASKKAD